MERSGSVEVLAAEIRHLAETIDKYFDSQDAHNGKFYETRDLALETKTRLDTGWKILCAVGMASGGLGAGAAWCLEHLTKFVGP